MAVLLGSKCNDVLENCDVVKCEMISLRNTLNHRSATNNISAYQIVWIQPTRTLLWFNALCKPKISLIE